MSKSIESKNKSLYKKLYLLTFTESGGVSQELKDSVVELFAASSYHLLVEEGGEEEKSNKEVHYHLHGILGTNYSRTNNFRLKVLTPMYKKLGKELTAWGVKVSNIPNLEGCLSYTYKDRRVLSHSGILLNTIKKWKGKAETNTRLKAFTFVNQNTFLKTMVQYIDAQGITPPKCYMDIRNVMEDMMSEKFIFNVDHKMKNRIGQLLQVYGSRSFSLSHLDMMCNDYA